MPSGSCGDLTRRTVLVRLAGMPAWLGSGAALGQASVLATEAATPQQVEVDIRDFGATGDGRADDTPAFRAMHRRLLSIQQRSPDCRLAIRLPKGAYRYRWNRWLWGLRYAAVIGERATLQCISDSPWDGDKMVLATNADPLRTIGINEPTGSERPNFGCAIHSAAPGQRSVTLRDPRNAGLFEVGRFVCILSFDQQFGGYPPNCRYFDYAVVQSVAGAQIALDRPLRFQHSAAYPEDGSIPESIGRARITPIDRPWQPLALFRGISGIRVVANPHARERMANAVLGVGVYELRVTDCELINLTPSMGYRCEVTDSRIEFTEPDKLLGELEFRNCRIGRISQATGVHRLGMSGCGIEQVSDIQARYVRLQGCRFEAQLTLEGFTPTRRLEVIDSVFASGQDREETATSSNPTIGIPLTPPITVVGRTIRSPFGDERCRVLLENLEPNDVVFLGASFAGTTFSDGRSGIIESIAMEGEEVVIRTTAPIRSGDVLFSFRVRRIVFQGNRYIGVKESPPQSLETTWEGLVQRSRTYRYTWTSAEFAQAVLACPGIVEGISVEVQRPYRGPDAGAFLRLGTRTPQYGTIVCTVDLTRAGARLASTDHAAGFSEGDVWRPIARNIVVWDFYVSHCVTPDGAARQLSGDEGQQAHYILRIDTVPFWQAVSLGGDEKFP
jgi:hypothetical protein